MKMETTIEGFGVWNFTPPPMKHGMNIAFMYQYYGFGDMEVVQGYIRILETTIQSSLCKHF